jgi:hypothetical protein
MFETLKLTDVDGTLCVCSEAPDYCEPRAIANHWPTVAKTRDALSLFDVDDVAKLECSRTMPGEYFVGVKNKPGFGAIWVRGQHVRLVDGGATMPIKTDIRELAPPKTRKGTLIYWSAGAWIKRTSKGVEKINPL